LTRGNYRVLRALSYPEYAESLIVLEVHVKAHKSEWATDIRIHGKYTAPTDIVSCQDYQIRWTLDGDQVLESGNALLELSSGNTLRQVWSSIITPKKSSGRSALAFEKFSADGQLIQASISRFQIEENRMSYEWEGTVQNQPPDATSV
jgi:hypothetical protein